MIDIMIETEEKPGRNNALSVEQLFIIRRNSNCLYDRQQLQEPHIPC